MEKTEISRLADAIERLAAAHLAEHLLDGRNAQEVRDAFYTANLIVKDRIQDLFGGQSFAEGQGSATRDLK